MRTQHKEDPSEKRWSGLFYWGAGALSGGWTTTGWDSKPLYSKVPRGHVDLWSLSPHLLVPSSPGDNCKLLHPLGVSLDSPTSFTLPPAEAFLDSVPIINCPSEEESAGGRGGHWLL